MLLLLMIAAAVPTGVAFACTPTQVWDGDSFTCSNGTKVRVAGIAAREVRSVRGGAVVDGGCGKGHPCPKTSGIVARKALAGLFGDPSGVGRHGHILVQGPALRCVSNGSAGRDRTGAWCSLPGGKDLSCAMVQGGYALKWDRYWRKHQCRSQPSPPA